ncbi:MAG: divalent-cation tolerance protein CutA [Planctomycetes bacterium]|nr:divalent-cation tolerance protein CutA [Planctomycetota bacterium]
METATTKLTLCAVPNAEVAAQIASTLVAEQLAACVSALGPMQSWYRWEGRIDTASEVLLLIKHPEHSTEELTERVKSLHPYALPEVLHFAVSGSLPEYLAWIAASCPPKRERPASS